MTEFKLNSRQQFKSLSFTFFSIVGVSILVFFNFFLDIRFGSISIKMDRYINFLPIIFGLSLIIMPSLYLYVEYLCFSYKLILKIDFLEKKIYLETRDLNCEFNFDEIEKIKKVCSYPEGENRINRNPTNVFKYHIIELKNNMQIIVTSLIADDIRIIGVKYEVKKKYIAFILPLNKKTLNAPTIHYP